MSIQCCLVFSYHSTEQEKKSMQVISTLNSLPLLPSLSPEVNNCSWGNNIQIFRKSITSYPLRNSAELQKQGTCQKMEAIFFLAICLSSPKCLSFQIIMCLDMSTLIKDKRSDASESYSFFGLCPALPCKHAILPFGLQTYVQAADSCWDSYMKYILAAFWPASASFKLNRKIPLNAIWAGTNSLTFPMYVSWVAFFLRWLWGGSLVIFSIKTCGSILQFWSYSLQGVTTQLHSQYTNLKSW